jgi:hypothetical protein
VANLIRCDTGLLPDCFVEVRLEADFTTGWRAAFVFVDSSEAELPFAGGTDPRAWLAQHLASEYGFSVVAAAETAARLFDGYLPPANVEPPPEPYGMQAPGRR